MNSEKKRLDNLIEHSTSVFQTNNNVHINARKSAEALCKLMIFKYYGEERGTAILYQQDKEWNSRLKVTRRQEEKSYSMTLNMLIKVCTSKSILRSCYEEGYQDKELLEVIRNTIIYLESNLYALSSRGNSSAHESYKRPLYAETTQNLLREVLEWLFEDFLKIEIPSELTCYIGTYDIFISYSQADEVWVEILKKNLLLHGYKLFIEHDQLISGENTKKSIRNAIKYSKNAMVVYPEKDASLWMKNELEWIEEQKKQQSDFKNIPIVIHKSLNLRDENITYTDFCTNSYEEAFNQLLSSLKGIPPSKNNIRHPLELPTTANQFVSDVSQHLESEKVVILFSQEFSKVGKYYRPIKEELKRKFSKHFYSISIPDYKKEKKYFDFIRKSCGIEKKIESLQEWKIAMQKKLEKGEEILLLITDFENGRENHNKSFASTLRNLSEQFNDNLYLVFVGHKQLAKLVFQEGDLSPLRSIGKQLFFPYDNTPISHDDIMHILSNSIIEEYKELLCKLLEKTEVERFSAWSYTKLINYLFWKGILIQKDDYIVWRDEEVKKIIKEICNG